MSQPLWLNFGIFPLREVIYPEQKDLFNDTLVATDDLREVYILDSILRWMYIIVPIIIYILGIPGNILACLVFRRRALRQNFLSKFFVVLCCNNLFCIVWGLTRHFLEGLIAWNLRLYSKTSCYLHSYLLIVAMCYGNWLLVIISGCRAFFIANPEKYNKSLTMSQTVFLLVISLVMNALPQSMIVEYGNWVTVDASTGQLKVCELSRGGLLAVISMSFFAFMPGILLLVFNTSIYWLHTMQVPDSMMNRASSKVVRNQLYLMILLTNIVFLVTNLPLGLYYSIFPLIFDIRTKVELARARLGLGISAMLFYIGQSMNVVLYCVFGSLFRLELKKILRPLCSQIFPEWKALETFSVTEFSSRQRDRLPVNVPEVTITDMDSSGSTKVELEIILSGSDPIVRMSTLRHSAMV